MDDFGTGYSSLSLLNSFPFDRIKVDSSFIQQTGNNNKRADAIFKAVVGLGFALNVPVLAEGVETQAQFDFASSSGCMEIQGFHFCRPIPERDLSSMRAAAGQTLHGLDIKQWQESLKPAALVAVG
jgi:diguanylate cyclase